MKFRVKIRCEGRLPPYKSDDGFTVYDGRCPNELEGWVEGSRTRGESSCGCCPGRETDVWEIDPECMELTEGWSRTWDKLGRDYCLRCPECQK